MTSCISPTRLLPIVVAGAIGLAPVSVALAQGSDGGKSASSAAASKQGSVAGVVVQAPPKSTTITTEKTSSFDAEATKHKAWQKYRATTPTPRRAPTTAASASARAENYPGLHNLPH
jgi:hypothetical protein